MDSTAKLLEVMTVHDYQSPTVAIVVTVCQDYGPPRSTALKSSLNVPCVCPRNWDRKPNRITRPRPTGTSTSAAFPSMRSACCTYPDRSGLAVYRASTRPGLRTSNDPPFWQYT